MRMARSWSWSVLACTAAMAGCVGKSTSGDPPDAPSGADAPKVDASMMIDAPAVFTCRDRITSGLDNGHHNQGQNCQQGCHNHNFYMSGTMYSSINGGPVAGASITFVDATGRTGDMRTNLNGNFWWTFPVTFPVKIIASMCPDIKPMTAMVQEAGAGCNQNGCHSAAGGAGRIHLP